jgi:hypothetical protein
MMAEESPMRNNVRDFLKAANHFKYYRWLSLLIFLFPSNCKTPQGSLVKDNVAVDARISGSPPIVVTFQDQDPISQFMNQLIADELPGFYKAPLVEGQPIQTYAVTYSEGGFSLPYSYSLSGGILDKEHIICRPGLGCVFSVVINAEPFVNSARLDGSLNSFISEFMYRIDQERNSHSTPNSNALRFGEYLEIENFEDRFVGEGIARRQLTRISRLKGHQGSIVCQALKPVRELGDPSLDSSQETCFLQITDAELLQTPAEIDLESLTLGELLEQFKSDIVGRYADGTHFVSGQLMVRSSILYAYRVIPIADQDLSRKPEVYTICAGAPATRVGEDQPRAKALFSIERSLLKKTANLRYQRDDDFVNGDYDGLFVKLEDGQFKFYDHLRSDCAGHTHELLEYRIETPNLVSCELGAEAFLASMDSHSAAVHIRTPLSSAEADSFLTQIMHSAESAQIKNVGSRLNFTITDSDPVDGIAQLGVFGSIKLQVESTSTDNNEASVTFRNRVAESSVLQVQPGDWDQGAFIFRAYFVNRPNIPEGHWYTGPTVYFKLGGQDTYDGSVVYNFNFTRESISYTAAYEVPLVDCRVGN